MCITLYTRCRWRADFYGLGSARPGTPRSPSLSHSPPLQLAEHALSRAIRPRRATKPRRLRLALDAKTQSPWQLLSTRSPSPEGGLGAWPAGLFPPVGSASSLARYGALRAMPLQPARTTSCSIAPASPKKGHQSLNRFFLLLSGFGFGPSRRPDSPRHFSVDLHYRIQQVCGPRELLPKDCSHCR